MNLLIGTCALLSAVMPAGGDLRELIERALDEPVDISVASMPVVQAFEKLSAETGIVVTIDPPACELLPYGLDTPISVEVRHTTLRDGLTRLSRQLGMNWEATDAGVRMFASKPLRRIGRRATVGELTLMSELAAMQLPDEQAVETLKSRVLVRAPGADPRLRLLTAIRNAGAGSAEELLTAACDSLGWSWYADGDSLVVLSKADQLTRQLRRRINLKYTQRALPDILRDIGEQADASMRFEPGTLANLPPDTAQRYSVIADNVTIEQALEQIAATTGLGYRLGEDAVEFYLPGASQASAESRSIADDPYIAKIVVEGQYGDFRFEWLVRESELPPWLVELRKEHIDRAVEELRVQLEQPTADTEQQQP